MQWGLGKLAMRVVWVVARSQATVDGGQAGH